MNEVTGYLQGSELVISLSGRIDSNNAQQVEEDNGPLSTWTLVSWIVTGALTVAAITSASLMIPTSMSTKMSAARTPRSVVPV